MAGRVTRTYSWSGSLLAEATHWMGNQAVYGRYEGLAIESEHLMFPKLVHPLTPGNSSTRSMRSPSGAFAALWRAVAWISGSEGMRRSIACRRG
jgi:hypothetical protein